MDWEIDWADAPLKYKIYRGLPTVPLCAEVPLALPPRSLPSAPDATACGHWLWYVFGLARSAPSGAPGGSFLHRRFVPSGGGLYPNELYVYLKTEGVPAGVYHYNAAHHSLVLLRRGNFDDYMSAMLGRRHDPSACFATVFVSTLFWKNVYKYNEFAYRLQGLDAGAMLGQLLVVSERFGYAPAVCFQFVDRAANRLLGLREAEESVYAVIPLSVHQSSQWWFPGGKRDLQAAYPFRPADADELCRQLPDVRHEHFMRSKRIKDYSTLLRMNEASMLHSPALFRTAGDGKTPRVSGAIRASCLPLSQRLPYDLAAAARRRVSPESEFTLGRVDNYQLSALLYEAGVSARYVNDLIGPQMTIPEPRLYVCLYNIEGIADGAYQYDAENHALRLIASGDHRRRLQSGMILHNVNLSQVPICFHIAGDREHKIGSLGRRGYRIQQMETGILMQRILLAASANEMGGRPLLGFRTSVIDGLYGFPEQGLTSLVQIPVGPYHSLSRFELGVHS